jgi:uncharacterized protein
MQILIERTGDALCDDCVVADGPLSRMRGLLGRSAMRRGEGLLLRPAGSIHTFFMRFAIDAVFLDEDLRVVRVASAIAPWRTAGQRGARAVLELPDGECERRDVRAGDRLVLVA